MSSGVTDAAWLAMLCFGLGFCAFHIWSSKDTPLTIPNAAAPYLTYWLSVGAVVAFV